MDEKVPRRGSHLRALRSHQFLADNHGQISVRWMMQVARGHYEGTFLKGPYFDAASPDFQSVCMHVSPAAFTWGNMPVLLLQSCQNPRTRFRCFGGLLVLHATAATSRFSSTEVDCPRLYLMPDDLEKRSCVLPARKKMNTLVTHPAGPLDN